MSSELLGGFGGAAIGLLTTYILTLRHNLRVARLVPELLNDEGYVREGYISTGLLAIGLTSIGIVIGGLSGHFASLLMR